MFFFPFISIVQCQQPSGLFALINWIEIEL